MAVVVRQERVLSELSKLDLFQSKSHRGQGRMEERDAKRSMYRPGVTIDIERARLITQAYKATEGEPMVIRRAKALAHLMDNMTLHIYPHELIVGNMTSKPNSINTFPELWWRWLDKAIDKEYANMVTDEERAELHEIHKYWQGKAVHGMERGLLPEEVRPYWFYPDHGAFLWLHGGHVGTPNYEKVLRTGMNGLIKECEQRLAELSANPEAYIDEPSYLEQRRFLEAASISLKALARFGQRFANKAREIAAEERDEARKRELEDIANICEWVPANPARTFREAVQSYWFTNLFTRVLDLQSSGYGERLDQLFYPYYEKDRLEGRITKEETTELLGLLFLKMNEEGGLIPPAQAGGGGTLITRVTTIGGQTVDGDDATNELTYITMDAKNEVGLTQPAIAVRLHRNTPTQLLSRIADSLTKEPGVYSFFNDEMMIPHLMRLGVPLEDARNYSTDGCMRWTIPGKAICVRGLGGMFILPRCLEYALLQGVNKLNGKNMGAPTPDPGAFNSIEDVIDAYLEQVRFFMAKLVTIYNMVDVLDEEWLPQPLLSAVVDGCIQKGQDCRKYKYLPNTIIQPIGQITVVDSLAAIKKLVSSP